RGRVGPRNSLERNYVRVCGNSRGYGPRWLPWRQRLHLDHGGPRHPCGVRRVRGGAPPQEERRLMERARTNPVRSLFWGLVCFSILMFFSAWAGIDSSLSHLTRARGHRSSKCPLPFLRLTRGCARCPSSLGSSS